MSELPSLLTAPDETVMAATPEASPETSAGVAEPEPEPGPPTSPTPSVTAGSLNRTPAYILWCLFAAGFVSGGLAMVCGLLYAYIRRGPERSDFENSHYQYAIHSFWCAMVWSVLGAVLSMVGIGQFIIVGALLWLLYRIIRGVASAVAGASV